MDGWMDGWMNECLFPSMLHNQVHNTIFNRSWEEDLGNPYGLLQRSPPFGSTYLSKAKSIRVSAIVLATKTSFSVARKQINE